MEQAQGWRHQTPAELIGLHHEVMAQFSDDAYNAQCLGEDLGFGRFEWSSFDVVEDPGGKCQ